jgi:hypothetical protein
LRSQHTVGWQAGPPAIFAIPPRNRRAQVVLVAMAEERSNEAATAPPFAFLWFADPLRTDDAVADMLLIWPVAERRPAGAFARFVTIEDEFGRTLLVTPMDIQTGDLEAADLGNAGAQPAATGGSLSNPPVREDVGTLPLLLRVPAPRGFTLTVHYLVRQMGAVAQVELVALPPVKFANLGRGEVAGLTIVGLFRSEGSRAPGRPIVVTGWPGTAEMGTRGAPTFVEIADEIFRACERMTAGTARPATINFIFAVPSTDDGTIGPVETVVPYRALERYQTPGPYRGAMIRASRGPRGQGDAEYPWLSCTVGESWTNRTILHPCIIFFHWDRMVASLQSREGQQGGSKERAARWFRGSENGSELEFAFEAAGFGDIVGVMVGPPERVTLLFPDRSGDPQLIEEVFGWIVAPFVWMGDELIPLYMLAHPDLGGMKAIVNADLDRLAKQLPTPDERLFSSNFLNYLSPLSSGPELPRFIEEAVASIGRLHEPNILALDGYCELLRELDRQIELLGRPDEWRRLEGLFSFPEFLRVPQLCRALIVEPNLRAHAARAIEWGRMADDVDVLAAVLRMMALNETDDRAVETWLAGLRDLPNVFAAWELMKREFALVRELIMLGIAPDFVLLADWFGGRAAAQVQAYRDCAPDRLFAAGLREVGRHRRDGEPIISYERIAAALDRIAPNAA